MADLGSILSSLGGIAGKLALEIIPGAGAIEDLVNAGKSISSAFNSVKSANGGTAPPEAEAQHEELMKKVNAHADGTLGRLEGGS